MWSLLKNSNNPLAKRKTNESQEKSGEDATAGAEQDRQSVESILLVILQGLVRR
jgi:hypothetical protein